MAVINLNASNSHSVPYHNTALDLLEFLRALFHRDCCQSFRFDMIPNFVHQFFELCGQNCREEIQRASVAGMATRRREVDI